MGPLQRQTVISILAIYISLLICTVIAQSDSTCSANKPCKLGCCSKSGNCGFGPDFCGTGNCTSTCQAKSECDPGYGPQWAANAECPLKVCCSKFGFCGTTKEFCGDKTVKSPSCGGTSSNQRTIGYYEGWSQTRKCDTMAPEEIPIGAYTHLNFAFAFINPSTYAIAPMDENQVDLYKRTTRLKELNPGMEVWISVGGWSMNDPDQSTHATFSALAGNKAAQSAFAASLISFMQTYGFDGVDIDWEYPVAPERSGNPADFDNYVTFLSNLKQTLGGSGHNYGLSITIPSSYWYLKNFDIVKISKIVDWFNMMSYDLHGTWDSTDKWVGAIVQAHTNLTEIDLALQLLWRNNIDPSQVVLGLGFYGRTFTLADPSCTNAGCPFSGGGRAGNCTDSVGTLSYAEIQRIIAGGAKVDLDKDAAVKRVLWGGNQWTSYDDADTFGMKVDYANKHCLAGTMVWAVSLDDSKGSAADALSKSTGRKTLAASADRSASYKASGPCYITECSDKPTCPSGYGAVQQINGNKQDVSIDHGCGKKQKRTYCCPSDDMPTCQWRGGAPACDVGGGCKSDEAALTFDTGGCSSGHKKLCCKTNRDNQALNQCMWKGTAPRCERDNQCPSDKPKELGRSISGDNQQECDTYGYGDVQLKQLKRFCCTDPPPYTGCDWYTDGDKDPPPSPRPARCNGRCPTGKTLIATDDMCAFGGTRAFCCDPTHTYNDAYVTDFKNKLLTFSDDHSCPAAQLEGGIHAKRNLVDAVKVGTQASNDPHVETRSLMARDFKSLGGYETLMILYTALPLGTHLSSLIVEAYNEVIGSNIGLLAVKDLQAGLDADPYNNKLFDLAWMLCDWSRAKAVVDGVGRDADICVLPNDVDYTDVEPEGDFDDPYKQKRRRRSNSHAHPNGFSSSDELLNAANSTEERNELMRRIFDEDPASNSRPLGGLPSTGLLMNAVMHDNLPLLYMQHVRYQANQASTRDLDTILEVVYDITHRPDLQFFEAGTAAGPFEPDRFAVFHFHTIGVTPDPAGGPSYPRIPYFHVFHGQRVHQNDHPRQGQYVVVQAGTSSGEQVPSATNPDTRGSAPGPNARTRILECGRGAGRQRLVWQPGQDVPRPVGPGQQTIVDFGTFLRRSGVLIGDNLPHWNSRTARWMWDPDPNHADFYTSDNFGPLENGLRQPPANMAPSAGWPG